MISIAQPTLAEEIIIPPAKQTPVEPETETKKQPQTKERLGLILEYYDRCLASAYTDLPDAVRQSYCACTAERLDNHFTKDEIYTMAKGAGPIVEVPKIIIDMEGPCLAYPMQEDIKNHCLRTARTNYFKTQEAFDAHCQCIGLQAYDYFNAYGRDLAALLLSANKAPPDNLTIAIRESRHYKVEFADWRKSCLLEYSEQGK